MTPPVRLSPNYYTKWLGVCKHQQHENSVLSAWLNEQDIHEAVSNPA